MADYISTLNGAQMDAALLDMAEHNSEAWAVGERNGVPVASSDVAYHNNAQYYAQQAQSIAPASVTEAVRWDVAQTALTDSQRTQARDNINATAYNYNILDNGWMIVNSRGQSSYTSAGYTVDRWGNGLYTTVTVNANGVTVANSDSSRRVFQQYVGNMAIVNQVCTISIKLQNGTIYSGTGTIPSSGNADFLTFDGNTFRITNQSTYINVSLMVAASSSVAIRAIKLELGSISTLAYDTPPDYGEELTRCIYSTADPTDTYANNGFGRSNPNMCDNPFFSVNQRGVSSYTTGNAYTVDRWKMNTWQSTSPTLTVNANGSVTLSSSTASGTSTSCALWQIIENGTKFAGKTVTLSVMVNALTGSAKMFICGAANGTRYAEKSISTGLNTLTFTLADSITGLSVYIGHHASSGGSGSLSLTVSAVKLELGTVSTLANDVPPEYGTELAKCQRYFLRLRGGYIPFGFGDAISTTSVRIFIPTPVTMRAKPTASMASGIIVRNINNASLTPTAITADGINDNGVAVAFTVTGATQYAVYLGVHAGNGSYIDLSADL